MDSTHIILGFALFISISINLTTNKIITPLVILLLPVACIAFAPPVGRTVVKLLKRVMSQLLLEKWAEFNASVQKTAISIMDVTITLAVKGKHGVQALYNFLRNAIQQAARKVRLRFRSETDPPEEVYASKFYSPCNSLNTFDLPQEQIAKKVALLVSLPYGESYSLMQLALRFEPPRPPSIDWQSNNKSNIPSLDSLRTSIRHFALCVVPIEAWDAPNKLLLEKFQYAKFWEPVGPEEGECVSWDKVKIKTIDAIMEVGVVSHNDDYISELCKGTLYKGIMGRIC